jgi:hypothetical protein
MFIMNKNWINTDEKLPAINEIIIYKGNLSGIEGRHTGNGFVQLKNGDVDQFDEWKPIHHGFVTMKVQHPEKAMKVDVKGRIVDNCFVGEFKDGITYGVSVPL